MHDYQIVQLRKYPKVKNRKLIIKLQKRQKKTQKKFSSIALLKVSCSTVGTQLLEKFLSKFVIMGCTGAVHSYIWLFIQSYKIIIKITIFMLI